MAYFNSEKKAKIAPAIKAVLKKYNLKGSLAVHHHSSVVLNIKSGPIDFIGNCNELAKKDAEWKGQTYYEAKNSIQVNVYHVDSHFSGVARDALEELIAVLNTDNYDKSDIMSDYFNVGHYVDVNIGKWDSAYELVK
jgi:hypothetical protein